MISRTPEPEVMDDATEAAEYDRMDHSIVNTAFIDDFLHAAQPADESGVLDVGTGTALIPIELAARNLVSEIVAVDRSQPMLKVAADNACGFADSVPIGTPITLLAADSRSLPFEDAAFDSVLSNSLIHHLPGSDDDGFDAIRASLSEMLRVLKPGGCLFLRDLLRPSSAAEIEALVSLYAGEESPLAKQLLRQSLHAALSIAEMTGLLDSLNLTQRSVAATSDRHWTIHYVKPRSA